MMLKPALRPPLRAPMRGATTLREGGGAWVPTLASFKAFLAANVGADNPHSLTVMPSPPTITTGTTLAGLSASALTDTYDYAAQASSFRFSGGGVVDSSGRRLFPVTTVKSGGNVSSTQSATSWRVGAVCNAAKVAIRVSGNNTIPYRFLVDGRYVDLAGTLVGTGGGSTYALLDFGSAASRLVEVEGEQALRFQSFNVAPGDTVVAATAAAFPILGLGDSFYSNTGPTRQGDGVLPVMADYLGINQRWCSGSGGTGYVTETASGYKLADRITADMDRMALIDPPKVVTLGMGLNDLAQTGAAIQAQAVICFDAIRAKFPAALVFVGDPWDLNAVGAPAAGYTTCRDALIAAMAGRGGFYRIIREGVTYTKSDGTHPDTAGALTLGQSDATAIRTTVAAA